jgi:hypothetical protein
MPVYEYKFRKCDTCFEKLVFAGEGFAPPL